MRFLFVSAIALLLIAGCESSQTSTSDTPTKAIAARTAVARIKVAKWPGFPATVLSGAVAFSGVRLPVSNDSEEMADSPWQVNIVCGKVSGLCKENDLRFSADGYKISPVLYDMSVWRITQWDAGGMVASWGPDLSAPVGSRDRCRIHTLTVKFASGSIPSGGVSFSDSSTGQAGCEKFQGTTTDRLVSGELYIDTSPGNDADNRSSKQ